MIFGITETSLYIIYSIFRKRERYAKICVFLNAKPIRIFPMFPRITTLKTIHAPCIAYDWGKQRISYDTLLNELQNVILLFSSIITTLQISTKMCLFLAFYTLHMYEVCNTATSES